MDAPDAFNAGIIQAGRAPGGETAPRTFIISGLGRSGTSMTAAILAGFGILSTSHAYDVTLDDREFLHLLMVRNQQGLEAAIAARNRAGVAWAFKLPSIHGYLRPAQLAAFRDPHLIIMMRDVVATALRHAVSEHMDPVASLFETARGQQDLMVFLEAVRCPLLLVSYEKAVRHPDLLVRSLAGFCAVTVEPEQVARLAGLVRPENPTYAAAATRRFEGNIDGSFRGTLIGWCREVGEPRPVSLDLLVNGTPIASFRADMLREDLKAAGIGDGRHGFTVSMGALGITAGAILAVRISGRTYEVPGSGKPAWMHER